MDAHQTSNTASSPKTNQMPRVTPRFPPDVTAINLIEKAIQKLDQSGQGSRIPNAFIAYRMAVCKELRAMNHPVYTQPQLSSMAKESWSQEPEHIRKAYQKIAAEARDLYKQYCRAKIPLDLENENQLMDAAGTVCTRDNIDFGYQSSQSSPSLEVCDPAEFSMSSPPWTYMDAAQQLYDVSPTSFNGNCPSVTSPTFEHTYYSPEGITSSSIYPNIIPQNNIGSGFNDMENLSHPSFANSESQYFIPPYDAYPQMYTTDQFLTASHHQCTSFDASFDSKACTNLNCREKIGKLQNRVDFLEEQLASLWELVYPKPLSSN